MPRALSRRRLLTLSAGAASSVALSWALRPARARARAQHKTLICIHLRGGADGLSMLVPHADPTYFRVRRCTALAAPGAGADAVIDLDGRFGLHPRLAPLAAWYATGELAAWPAVGSQLIERSHGRAERRLRDGIGRSLSPERVLWLGEQRPGVVGWPLQLQLERVAREIESGPAPAVAWTELAGWDTHVAQGAADGGRLAERLGYLATTLSWLRRRIAEHWNDVAVAIVTEFGRSVLENDCGGTDDGHASALFLLGGAISGGRVFGSWPKLGTGAGLPATTDMTQLMAELVRDYAGTV